MAQNTKPTEIQRRSPRKKGKPIEGKRYLRVENDNYAYNYESELFNYLDEESLSNPGEMRWRVVERSELDLGQSSKEVLLECSEEDYQLAMKKQEYTKNVQFDEADKKSGKYNTFGYAKERLEPTSFRDLSIDTSDKEITKFYEDIEAGKV